ncbi:Lon family ATP-dependent protease [Fuchsiella alkaliacetigena]|uniref:Lon family ATP-dependent protease n=1 Tax=Fuchsiella alkaliacetigena TaxID=957042 RepID=UPI00200A0175|nr:Lon family ATP-dependent protease [Fuchsiella alkaliacetigena]MCK8824554.1 Lon family ATP-dependent protease [Fuchsiella alkaliacetigena]
MKEKIKNLFAAEDEVVIDQQFKEEQLEQQIAALFSLLAKFYGKDELVLKAGKLEALDLMESESPFEQLIALQKVVYADPTLTELKDEVDILLSELEEEITDLVVQESIKKQLDQKIAVKMEQRNQEYLKELKQEIIAEELGKVDSPETLRKYGELEKLESQGLVKSARETLRPSCLEEIVGQENPIRSLLAKLASPYPQHIIIYGPPGVGKTTAARLALDKARAMEYTPFSSEADFVEVDGATLRWDPREATNPLLGSVHDPIYQGASQKLAKEGVPEPKTGLVTEAHGGVLFIDEIGELDPVLQNKLLKVLEDKRVYFDSSYYDADDENIPQYIRKLFEEGAPADFVLVGATTRSPAEINPALRSRTVEVFFEPLQREDIELIIENAQQKLEVELEAGVKPLISEYTIEGRQAISILADAYSLALYEAELDSKQQESIQITENNVYQVVQASRLVPFQSNKASSTPEVGKVLGLGVKGFLGSILEIEAVAFSAPEKKEGRIRFNEAAGSMAKDAVFNAASVVRKTTGQDLKDYDLHINVVGGAQIDGPSAGLATVLAIISALQGKAVRQDVAITGEVSIRGKVKAVGGIVEKIYGAKQAGIKEVFIPYANRKQIPENETGVKINLIKKVEEVLEQILIEE